VILAEDETDLRLFPPLRASWSPRGSPEQVELSGANAKRVLFGCVNIRTGHRLRLVRGRQRSEDFREMLNLIHGSYRPWKIALLLDEDSSHTARASCALAAKYRIHLEWLPKRSPHLNPMDHLWRYSKGVALANRQEASIDDLVKHALTSLDSLSNREALRKAGLLSHDCWLRSVL
jgi:transposase